MIFPTASHIVLWIVLVVCALAGTIYPAVLSVWKIVVGFYLGGALLDMFFAMKRPEVQFHRTVHTNLPVTYWSKVHLKITNDQRYSLELEVHDFCHADFQVKHQPGTATVAAGSFVEMTYQLFPKRRGKYVFPGADLFVKSPLRLWQKKWFVECASEIKVFPNFREIGRYALLATHNHLSMMGVRKLARRGEGKDFHQLREYRQGDELQKIDWKATSRYRRLISKEYQDERDQQIVFVLDSGRRMTHVEDGRYLLDQALNSILLLTYVASKQGDGVGLYCFGGTEKWLPPRKQQDSVRAMLLAMYDIKSAPITSDYLRASRDIMAHQRRRALVVIITNSRAEEHADLFRMVGQLRRKHLVVVANLRETTLDENQFAPVGELSEAIRYQALQQYLAERKKFQKKLRHQGVISLDVTGRQLPTAMVNSYLEIKGAGSL